MIDLHTHTNFSDGALSPLELIDRAVYNKVSALAICDHDTIDALEVAQSYLKLNNLDAIIRLITGVEISCIWRDTSNKEHTIHLLALNFKDDAKIKKVLEHNFLARWGKAHEVDLNLSKLGINNSLEEIKAQVMQQDPRQHSDYKENFIGSNFFADFLVKHKLVEDKKQAFKKYLGSKGSVFVRADFISFDEAVEVTLDSNAIAVIAHPGLYNLSNADNNKLLQDFAAINPHNSNKAIEIVTNRNLNSKDMYFNSLAKKYDLYHSAGSDFHRPNQGKEIGALAKSDKLVQNIENIL